MREKLIELLNSFTTPIMLLDTKLMDWTIPTEDIKNALAVHLIANGVTVPVKAEGYSFKDREEIDFDYNAEDV